jgi:hypothetical protein
MFRKKKKSARKSEPIYKLATEIHDRNNTTDTVEQIYNKIQDPEYAIEIFRNLPPVVRRRIMENIMEKDKCQPSV